MTGLHQHIQRTIRREDLLPAGARLVIGVSGGPDSVALVHLLLELSDHGAFAVIGLAHLNHQLRASAARDGARGQYRHLSRRLTSQTRVGQARRRQDERARSLTA